MQRVHLGRELEQLSDHQLLASSSRDDERSNRRLGHHSAVGARRDEDTQHVYGAHLGRHVASSHAARVARVGLGASAQQRRHELGLVLAAAGHQRRQAIVARGVDVGAAAEQCLDYRDGAILSGGHQSRRPLLVQRVHVRATLQQQRHHGGVPRARRHRERREAGRRERLKLRTGLDERLRRVEAVGRSARLHQSAHPLDVLGVGVRRGAKQHAHHLRMRASSCCQHRRRPLRVLGVCVCSSRQQQLHYLRIAYRRAD
mmetsp:Transcript_683/g.1563  ORF Transcript_683/g.1563 Transcript_683/m.1563 type:complete len:258 (+) Transcript_683:1989-2762(+)